jgi:predicted dehydrogenase
MTKYDGYRIATDPGISSHPYRAQARARRLSQGMRTIADVGAAVIGTGFVGTIHVEALRRIGVSVRGVLGSTPERGAARAAALGVPRAYASLDELLDDPTVDAVHVTSPNDLHLPQARAILDAGRHVICEKPLAMSASESRELVALAAATGLVNAANFNVRYYPLNQHAREFITSGEIGDVRLVTGRYFQDWLLFDTDWNWRLQPEHGGALRAVGDIGSHWLDLTTFITGQPIVSVMAELATFVEARREPAGPVETYSTEVAKESVAREIGTEDAATILLRFENGARGSLSVSQISAGRKNSLQYEVGGSLASVAWDSEQPDQMWIGHRERPNEILIKNPALMGEAGRAAATLPGGHVEGFGDTFAAHFRAVYADIAAGRPDEHPGYPTFADGHDEMLVNDAIAESARLGRWVDVVRDPVPVGAAGPLGRSR